MGPLDLMVIQRSLMPLYKQYKQFKTVNSKTCFTEVVAEFSSRVYAHDVQLRIRIEINMYKHADTKMQEISLFNALNSHS